MAKRSKSSSEPQKNEVKLANFEPELLKLQEAVAKLEGGELTLEEAFGQWENGCTSYVKCRTILQSAKSRIETLSSQFSETDPRWELFADADGFGHELIRRVHMGYDPSLWERLGCCGDAGGPFGRVCTVRSLREQGPAPRPAYGRIGGGSGGLIKVMKGPL